MFKNKHCALGIKKKSTDNHINTTALQHNTNKIQQATPTQKSIWDFIKHVHDEKASQD